MTLPVRTSELASDEFGEAVRWYEARRSGLGGEFFDAVAETLSLIETNPAIGVMISGDGLTRRAWWRGSRTKSSTASDQPRLLSSPSPT